MRYASIALILLVSCALASAVPVRADDGALPRVVAPRPTVAVAEFTGDDAATAKFIADALLTDLAQSRVLRLVERSQLDRAQTELHLRPEDAYGPERLQAFGRLVRADRLVVGSYLVRGDQIMVSARVLDVGTGRLVDGAGASVSGGANSLLVVVHRLAHLLHYKLTGAELTIDGEGAEPPDGSATVRRPADAAAAPRYRVGDATGGQNRLPQAGATDQAANGQSRAMQPPAQWQTPPQQYYDLAAQPVVPTYVPYYVPLYYGYPTFSFGWSTRRVPFGRFGRVVRPGMRRR
jgi:TolB-like protein